MDDRDQPRDHEASPLIFPKKVEATRVQVQLYWAKPILFLVRRVHQVLIVLACKIQQMVLLRFVRLECTHCLKGLLYPGARAAGDVAKVDCVVAALRQQPRA